VPSPSDGPGIAPLSPGLTSCTRSGRPSICAGVIMRAMLLQVFLLHTGRRERLVEKGRLQTELFRGSSARYGTMQSVEHHAGWSLFRKNPATVCGPKRGRPKVLQRVNRGGEAFRSMSTSRVEWHA